MSEGEKGLYIPPGCLTTIQGVAFFAALIAFAVTGQPWWVILTLIVVSPVILAKGSLEEMRSIISRMMDRGELGAPNRSSIEQEGEKKDEH